MLQFLANPQVALALGAAIQTIEAGVTAYNRISAITERARAENRDLSADELATLAAETDALHAATLARLRALEGT